MLIINMLAFLTYILGEIFEQCELPDFPGYIITKYYKPLCPYSIRIQNTVDEIDSKLERNGVSIPIRYVNCNECDCKTVDKVKTVPALAIHKDGIEIDRFPSSGTYDQYAQFILKNIDLDKKILDKEVKNTPGKVLKMKMHDFEYGLDGAWLVWFYDNRDSEISEILEKLAEELSGKLNVGEINANRHHEIAKKFNISHYPLIMGFYGDISMPLSSVIDAESVKRFASKLIEPSFQELDYQKFKQYTHNLASGEPIFIVFTKDYQLAGSYFKKIAHDYKFRAKIYKSNDENLMKHAFVSVNTGHEEGFVSDENKVVLTAYKNGIFHTNPHKLSNLDSISEWIFYTHYPHLTRITNENFYPIFHGLKPVVLLLSQNEIYVNELERFSAFYHGNMPFTDFVFASLDEQSFPLFIPSLLPKIKSPTIVIFVPYKHLFYHKKMRLDTNNFNEQVLSMINDFENGKLGLYPPKASKYLYYSVAASLVGLVGIFAYQFLKRKTAE